jgi:Icc-related predicted phosphoesterase
MKILAIGDFHGEFPKKIKKIIEKEKIDLVVSIGDYPPFSLKKEFFKYVYGKEDVDLWDFIGKSKYKTAVAIDQNRAENVIKKLNNLSVPVITILGNHDLPWSDDVSDIKKPSGKRFWKWDWNHKFHLRKFILKNKNIKLIDYSAKEFNGFIFIGGRGHSFPGKVKSKAFRKHKQILENLFKKYQEENRERRIILLYHNSPYNTKLDKITLKDAHKKVKGKHYGSKMSRKIIDKYQPVLSLSGHIEEGFGMQRLGKTICVNTGSIHHGKGSIIGINDNGKINVKFIR